MLLSYVMHHSYRSYVRVVTSQRAGMGKSLYIKRCMEALHEMGTTDGPHEVIVPIHGPSVTPNTLVGALKEHIGINYPIIFHFDIAPSVSSAIILCNYALVHMHQGHMVVGSCVCVSVCVIVYLYVCNLHLLKVTKTECWQTQYKHGATISQT